MENYVPQQIVSFFHAALLGLMAGVLYDLLRQLRLYRRRSRALTHLLDSVYVLVTLLLIFLFALRQGEGELRLYMLLAIVLGMAAYFLLFADVLRPVWAFWVEVCGAFLRLLWRPAAFCLRCGKKFQIYIKKLFYFWRRYATIEK